MWNQFTKLKMLLERMTTGTTRFKSLKKLFTIGKFYVILPGQPPRIVCYDHKGKVSSIIKKQDWKYELVVKNNTGLKCGGDALT